MRRRAGVARRQRPTSSAKVARNRTTEAVVQHAVCTTCAVWSCEMKTRLSGQACGLHVWRAGNIESSSGATKAVTYPAITSTRAFRLISRPLGYASSRWMKVAMNRLPKSAPSVYGTGVVRLAETADEDAEADGDHQHPGAVRRAPCPADQSGENERPADEQSERSRDGRVRLVITGGDDRDGDPTRDERSRPEVEPGPPGEGHAIRRAAIAAPDKSAFGTKPLAPQTWMQRP